jgi:hypothetical protein
VLQLVLAGLQSGQWGRKKAAATVISQICQTSGDALASHAPALLDALLKASAGLLRLAGWLLQTPLLQLWQPHAHPSR